MKKIIIKILKSFCFFELTLKIVVRYLKLYLTIFANKKKKQTKFYWLIKKYRKKLKILSAKYLENIISNLYAQKILEKLKMKKY